MSVAILQEKSGYKLADYAINGRHRMNMINSQGIILMLLGYN